MNRKLAVLGGAGTCGTVAVAIGLGITQSLPKTDESKKLKSRYSKAIPDIKNSAFWSEKNTLLKYFSPVHHLLKQAGNEKAPEKSKQLHQQGYKNIYESEEDKYFEDFKRFCSKNNQNVISGTWITAEKTNVSSKLDAKLEGLRSYNRELIEELSKIQTSLKSTTFNESERKLISEACSNISTEVYLGEEDLTTKNAITFCTKG